MKSYPEFFEFVANEIFIGVTAFSLPDLKCCFMNKMARENLAVSHDQDVSGLDLRQFFPESSHDRFRPLSEDFLHSEGLSQDVLVKRIDGSKLIADVGIRVINSGSESRVLLMIRDVTLQKKLQRDLTAKQDEIQKAFQEILVQNKALKDLDRAKDKFIALTTHELRTPLSAMIATAEVLALKLYDTDAQRDEFITTIHQEGLHLLEIVNDILDFSKIQAGKMDFFVGQHDVSNIVKRLCHQFEQMAEQKSVSLKLEGFEDPSIVFVDPLRFKQAFSNVINNAIKFTAKDTTVTILLRQKDGLIGVAVKDQGTGIAPENISKVFNEFETVGNVNSHQKGTGLGMPITKKIMEAMGGRIDVETQLGHGAEFTLWLPIERVLSSDFYKDRPTEMDDLAA